MVTFGAEYGVLAVLAALLAWCWWRVARRQGAGAPAAVAGVAWAVLSAGLAVLLSVPVRSLVARRAPVVDHDQLTVLVPGRTGFSFVSGHATLAMAVAVGLFMVHRRTGLAAIALAALDGLGYVFMGTHYPTDVIGGFALGTATSLLLAPLAMLALAPLAAAVGRGRAAVLVRAPGRPRTAGVRGEPYPEPTAADKDLAA
ncbi:integral membrane protein [Streptantibioticus cattleyicolor NRRL 8057 = DSM 46488]|uniref:Integral membrane protein n=1 Tax=Streptantibioticus cattleyicolor (strain ATCC 35852 / DSM 46488 / JCM 4925 / NBRC 14057 / NRRL 8057) TaxID=1003195 RepID=G8WWQ8_STREN|nr:integral membrane protein [Streptantibioticus cattleyicolor NRRL 8057 = DSM 46488]